MLTTSGKVARARLVRATVHAYAWRSSVVPACSRALARARGRDVSCSDLNTIHPHAGRDELFQEIEAPYQPFPFPPVSPHGTHRLRTLFRARLSTAAGCSRRTHSRRVRSPVCLAKRHVCVRCKRCISVTVNYARQDKVERRPIDAAAEFYVSRTNDGGFGFPRRSLLR